MRRAERVARPRDGNETGRPARRRPGEALRLGQRDRWVRLAVQDQPWRSHPACGGGDVERALRTALNVVERVRVEGEDLPGPRVQHLELAGGAPEGALIFVGPAL